MLNSWSFIHLFILVCLGRVTSGRSLADHQDSCLEINRERQGVECECQVCETFMFEHNDMTTDSCCDCRSKFVLQLVPLQIEYTMLGWAEILGDNQSNSELEYRNGGLLFIPWNTCDFPRLRRLDLAGNMIVRISSLSCLRDLDELDLSRNLIHHLRRDTFYGMNGLRILDVSKNNIHVLDSGTLGLHIPNIKEIDISYNELEEFDVSNFNINSFCGLTLSNNKLRKLINKVNITTDLMEHRGPGMVDIKTNNFTQFPDWNELNVGNITSLGVLGNWGFDVRDNPWICDCMLYSFLSLAQKTYKAIESRDYFKVRCENPPEVHDRLVMTLDPSQFICNLTELCPSVCKCRSQPSVLSIFVDCLNAGLTELPIDLPDMPGLSLVLDLSGNSITELTDRPYLPRVKILDLSDNDITTVSPEAARRLQNATEINLKGNQLKYVPKELQIFPPSVLKIEFDSVYCNCTLGWVVDWMNNYQQNNTNRTCHIVDTDSIVNMDDFLQTCYPESLIPAIVGGTLGSLAVLAVSASVLSYVFRYEILVFCHAHIGQYQRRLRSKVHPMKTSDIYLSVGDDDIVWAKDELIPRLEEEGIRVFVPERDIDPGEVEVDAILKAISSSQNAFVIVSRSYTDSESKMDEFNFLCRSMVKTFSGIVSVATHENINKKDNTNPYLRAFYRLNLYHKGLGEEVITKALANIKPTQGN